MTTRRTRSSHVFCAIAQRIPFAVLLVLLVLQTSCTGLAYVTQAAAGQDDLNRRARDIDDLVREQRVDARMRRLLSQVAPVKRFGERHGLLATENYTKYVRLDRPAVVYVVSASEALRFKSRSWSFPLVGSFTYLGWFKKDDAQRFAASMRGDGWDVDVRGSAAYSTAGFFEDAVLSTMIPKGNEALGSLANTILHESAHATIFVHHQSTLNESVANFIGDQLAKVYIDETLGAQSPEALAYFEAERASEQRGRAMHDAYEALDAIYKSARSDAEKLAEKAALIARLRAELRYARPIGNATLIQYKTYNSGQEELHALLAACGADWPRFIAKVKTLESAPFARAQEPDIGKVIRPLVAAGCPVHGGGARSARRTDTGAERGREGAVVGNAYMVMEDAHAHRAK